MKAQMEEAQKKMSDPATQAQMKQMQEKMNDPQMKAMMEQKPSIESADGKCHENDARRRHEFDDANRVYHSGKKMEIL
jgi:hypothetical protein